MGVEIEDAGLVAGLIGTKVFADELISFTDLNDMVCNRQIQVSHAHFTSQQGNRRYQASSPPRCRILANSTKHCSCLTFSWYRHLANSSKHHVVHDSAHWPYGMKT